MAALTAKQVIVQRIREAERGKIYDEYVEKTDEILTAVVYSWTPTDVNVELGKTAGILENSEMIPGRGAPGGRSCEGLCPGSAAQPDSGMHAPQVRVSRIHPNLVKRLFEMEVPEIATGVVTIKSMAREAGAVPRWLCIPWTP